MTPAQGRPGQVAERQSPAPDRRERQGQRDRKLYYNLTITAVSVIVALIVGGLAVLNLICDQLGLTEGDGFWGAVGSLNDNFGVLGYVIGGLFIAAWAVSYVVYRVNRYDEI